MGVIWESPGGDFRLTFSVYEDAQQIADQVNVFRRALWGYLGAAALLLVLVQVLVLRWSLLPLRNVERELTRVGVGTRAVIRVEGGAGERFEGSVVRVSDAVRSRSAAQPVPVVDLQVDFAALPEGLRPGQPVRVTLEVAE